MPVSLVKYVAYYRVSTKRQGQSGLGLEAQQAAVEQLRRSTGGTVIAFYTEIETGKRSDRKQLQLAIQHARLSNATLVVAKMDRLARNYTFTLLLQESGLKFVCCDNPNANDLTIRILAAIAQHEAEMISTRTKDALQAAKARGTLLGSARPGHWEGREEKRQWQKAQPLACKAHREKTQKRYEFLMPEIKRRREAGESLPCIVNWLNSQGHVTSQNKPFTVTAVWRLIKRYLGDAYLGFVNSKITPVLAQTA